jgi:Leucine-rich repeat (LRR) protein
MRLPLDIAMEVGSFLDRRSLTVCTTQLCWDGVEFVSRPCKDSGANVTTIQLHKLVELCSAASEAPTMGQEHTNSYTNGLVAEAIKRIDLCLVRRTSAEKVVVVVFDLTGVNAIVNADIYSDIHHHYSLSSNLQFENGPSLAVEWHARARSMSGVTFLLGEINRDHLNNGRPLALCQSLHTLDLKLTDVRDVSALAWCQALHTLNLFETPVRNLSPLASCPALHTLDLALSAVDDVSTLASCQALHTLYLTSTGVVDVSPLASCQALHTLHLDETVVSDVSALASCPALHTLDLNNTLVKDVSALASCQALQILDLNNTHVSDVSALAACQTLHTLRLNNTLVKDVSALVSCQALHTLCLDGTPVSDVSALVSCGSLRNLIGCGEHMLGYEVVARLLENRS